MRNKLHDLIFDGMVKYVEAGELSVRVDAEAFADFLIANGVTIQQWIPVTERLPEETGWYRVCHKSKLISDRYFYSDSPEAFARFGSDPVTHWKPIEEPPKEGE
jgi:hypothetical protein